ncbi:hypothetical protein [uncultured Stenotrophomonas sp.]|uniref:NMCC_0638 family (lipo)protein n=1 Tax=uncultured Stenotrophomonas sp. TaxID=165438 RepID=UPI0025EBE30E|nr:hypothetical protein [uncultured Stenotrophomonas sp.]
MKYGSSLYTLLAAIPLLASSTAHANDDSLAPIGMFAGVCLDLLDKPDTFVEVMSNRGDRVQDAEASEFLGHKPGKAWYVNHEGIPYGFSWADDGTCRITIFSGDAKGLAKEFGDLGRMAPAGYASTAELTSIDERGWTVHTYTWHGDGEDRAIQMRLSLNPEPGTGLRGNASARYLAAPR